MAHITATTENMSLFKREKIPLGLMAAKNKLKKWEVTIREMSVPGSD